jgi:hypothetical protein
MITDLQVRTRLYGFIKQAVILHQKGKPHYYHTALRMKSLSIVQQLEIYPATLTLDQVKRKVIRYATHLRQVLPHPSNRCYNTTAAKLEELIKYCEQTTRVALP